jgi:hypothetical protein
MPTKKMQQGKVYDALYLWDVQPSQVEERDE